MNDKQRSEDQKWNEWLEENCRIQVEYPDMVEMEQIKSELKCRLQKAGIGHATLELELPGQPCQKEPCH